MGGLLGSGKDLIGGLSRNQQGRVGSDKDPMGLGGVWHGSGGG